jgi:hypothetical protein
MRKFGGNLKRNKLLHIMLGVVFLIVALGIGSIYWELRLVAQEAPVITQTVKLMISGYRKDDAEQIYAQMVSIEQGGLVSLDELSGAVAGPDLEFEIYRTMQVEVLRISLWRYLLPFADDKAVAKMILTFENGCQIPYLIWLRQIDGAWKVYDIAYEDMSVFEVRACIRGD